MATPELAPAEHARPLMVTPLHSAPEGDLRRGQRPSGAEAAAAWLVGYTGNTRNAYRRDLEGFARWCDSRGLELLDVRRPAVDLYARELGEVRGLAPATVGRKLSALSSFYRFATDEGIIERSPLTNVRRPRTDDESQATGLDRNEAERFLDAAREAGPRDHALACLLTLNGPRVSEVCRADVEDLRSERGHRTLTVVRKGGRRAVLVLAPRTAEAVDTHVGNRAGGPLILANDGTRLNRHQATRIVRRLARAAGLPEEITPHSLRHTFVTTALDAGAALRDVQDAAGHADPRTTRRYDRARRSLDRHPTYAVASYLSP